MKRAFFFFFNISKIDQPFLGLDSEAEKTDIINVKNKATGAQFVIAKYWV